MGSKASAQSISRPPGEVGFGLEHDPGFKLGERKIAHSEKLIGMGQNIAMILG